MRRRIEPEPDVRSNWLAHDKRSFGTPIGISRFGPISPIEASQNVIEEVSGFRTHAINCVTPPPIERSDGQGDVPGLCQKRSSLLKKSPGTTAAVVLVLLGRLARH